MAMQSKVGNVYKSDYDLGWDYWYCRKPLPLGASRALQQGFVKAAKSADAFLMSCMREQARIGLFVFLPGNEHLMPDSGKPLSSGCESRYAVRLARAAVACVKQASAAA